MNFSFIINSWLWIQLINSLLCSIHRPWRVGKIWLLPGDQACSPTPAWAPQHCDWKIERLAQISRSDCIFLKSSSEHSQGTCLTVRAWISFYSLTGRKFLLKTDGAQMLANDANNFLICFGDGFGFDEAVELGKVFAEQHCFATNHCVHIFHG